MGGVGAGPRMFTLEPSLALRGTLPGAGGMHRSQGWGIFPGVFLQQGSGCSQVCLSVGFILCVLKAPFLFRGSYFDFNIWAIIIFFFSFSFFSSSSGIQEGNSSLLS